MALKESNSRLGTTIKTKLYNDFRKLMNENAQDEKKIIAILINKYLDAGGDVRKIKVED